jgi:hypothetical protein
MSLCWPHPWLNTGGDQLVLDLPSGERKSMMSGSIGSVLKRKGHEIHSVAPDATVHDAITIMAAKNVAAVVIMSEDTLVGILSARDTTFTDNTPTHSYMKYLYKHPQAAFPYTDLIETNKRRNRGEMEYELLDTGIFNGDCYFDVFVEYAKHTAEDLLVQMSVVNRGPESATIHLLPGLWFRNTWTWWPSTPKPSLRELPGKDGWKVVAASHAQLGERYLYCERDVPLLFTENETNNERIFSVLQAGLAVQAMSVLSE